MIALAIWVGLRVAAGGTIDADLTALLPPAERDPVVADAASEVRRDFERRLVLLVGASDSTIARAAAEDVYARLAASGAFAALQLRVDQEDYGKAALLYFSHRFQLLSRDSRRLLLAGDERAFERDVLARYFSPAAPLGSELVQHDPLLLFAGFLEEKRRDAELRMRPRDGMLELQNDGRSYVLISGVIADSPFSFTLQTRLVPVLEGLRVATPERFPGAELLIAGALRHAASGTARARSEVSTLGLLSIGGIVFVLVAVFRSAAPLALSIVSIAIGCLVAFAACLAAFGEVFLLTLVFGASLVGISVDYSLHYFCAQARLGSEGSPAQAIRLIFPGITLGLLTSIVGFAGLLLSSFPGLQQIAVFSAAGLTGAYVCVIAWYPPLTRPRAAPRTRNAGLFARAAACERWWREDILARQPLVLLPALALIGVAGALRLVPQDDVRSLQTRDPIVVAEEERVQATIGLDASSQFFLVEGRDAADLLAREERLTDRLRQAREAGALAGYVALSDFVPSAARQAENRELIKSLIAGPTPAIRRVADRIGLAEGIAERYVKAYSEPAPTLSLERWLATPVAAPYRGLWLDRTERGVASIVALKGIRDVAALRVLTQGEDDIHWVDVVGDLSAVFAHSRVQAVWLMLLAYAAVGMVAVVRYGRSGGLRVMLPPALAAMLVVGILGFVGERLNLFHVMALFLVLGVGVDYSLFLREVKSERSSAVVAIALSAMTTALGFGLLAFSSTQAIHDFGLTVLIGIAAAFLLSPLAGRQKGGG